MSPNLGAPIGVAGPDPRLLDRIGPDLWRQGDGCAPINSARIKPVGRRRISVAPIEFLLYTHSLDVSFMLFMTRF
jgi:hypothetical protein